MTNLAVLCLMMLWAFAAKTVAFGAYSDYPGEFWDHDDSDTRDDPGSEGSGDFYGLEQPTNYEADEGDFFDGDPPETPGTTSEESILDPVQSMPWGAFVNPAPTTPQSAHNSRNRNRQRVPPAFLSCTVNERFENLTTARDNNEREVELVQDTMNQTFYVVECVNRDQPCQGIDSVFYTSECEQGTSNIMAHVFETKQPRKTKYIPIQVKTRCECLLRRTGATTATIGRPRG